MHVRWWNTNEITNKIADWSQEKKKEKKKFRVPWDLSFAQKINQKKDIWSLKPLAESWCSILLRHAHVGSHLVHQALLAKQVLWVRQSSLWLLLHLHCSWAAIIFIPHISTVISQTQCWWYWLKNHEKWKWSVENWRLRSWKMHHPRDLLSFRFKSSESNLTNTILITCELCLYHWDSCVQPWCAFFVVAIRRKKKSRTLNVSSLPLWGLL